MSDNETAQENDAADGEETAEPMPPIDFTTFVLSLSTSALMHLGQEPSGMASGKQTVDLAMARQNIDLLALLEDKTRGNLTGEEERLLHGVLTDLRVQYVRAKK